MDLLDVIDPNFGIVEDKNTGKRFGDKDQLEAIGWSGKNWSRKKIILFCSECAKDTELFGEGYFLSDTGNLSVGKIPCGCAVSYQKSENQYRVIARRVCEELGVKFIGWAGEFSGILTKCILECAKHGAYSTTSLNSLKNQKTGCRKCADESMGVLLTKSDEDWTKTFLLTGMFHQDTTFVRSDEVNKRGYNTLWSLSCPVCGWAGLSDQSNLAAGKVPCKCSYITKMTEAYINIVSDGNTDIALKFGISSSSKRRVRVQNKQSTYNLRQFGVWKFLNFSDCRAAESYIKRSLTCGIFPKEEMLDGFTETTYLYNLDKIISIYESNGGVRMNE